MEKEKCYIFKLSNLNHTTNLDTLLFNLKQDKVKFTVKDNYFMDFKTDKALLLKDTPNDVVTLFSSLKRTEAIDRVDEFSKYYSRLVTITIDLESNDKDDLDSFMVSFIEKYFNENDSEIIALKEPSAEGIIDVREDNYFASDSVIKNSNVFGN